MTCEAFFAALNEIRAGRKVFSNSYLSRNDIERALADSNTSVIHDNGLLALLTQEAGLARLIFYSDGLDPLDKLPEVLINSACHVVADIVGRREMVDRQAIPLMGIGFRKYSAFVRMSAATILPLEYDRFVSISAARVDDAGEILSMLKCEFDPIFAHIPTEGKIRSAIEKKEISVVYDGATVAGLTYFEVISDKMKCLRYFMVRKAYRGKGIGGALLMNEFAGANARCTYYLWVGSYNKTSMLYKRMGFTEDGLVDHIMLYHKEDEKHGDDL